MEQLRLFDIRAVDRELERLDRQRAHLTEATRAYNTQLAFRYDWKSFTAWCTKTNNQPLPASSDTIALYITSLIDRGLRASTGRRHLTTIAYMHRAAGRAAPDQTEALRILAGARRLRQQRPLARAALRVADLRRICRSLDPRSPGDVRDRALLLFGFTSALRRSTLVSLDLDDISFTRKGVLVLVRREKQDQEGRGRWIGLPHGKRAETCPVRTLRAWLRIRGHAGEALFTHVSRTGEVTLQRMDPDKVRRLVKQAVERIGLHPALYGSHSLRAGLVTAAGEAGASPLVIAKQTGHKSLAVLRTYFRAEDPFRGNPCQVLGL